MAHGVLAGSGGVGRSTHRMCGERGAGILPRILVDAVLPFVRVLLRRWSLQAGVE